MILDERTEFADAVSVASTAGTINVGDVIDSSVVRDLGQGQPVYLVVLVDTEIITGGSAGTIQFQLVSDAVTTPDTSSATKHLYSPIYTTDDSAANSPELNAGETPWIVAIPPEGEQYERYLGLQAVIGTTTTTAGAVNAFLTLDPRGWKSYPDATN
jgi:hypothetical protein